VRRLGRAKNGAGDTYADIAERGKTMKLHWTELTNGAQCEDLPLKVERHDEVWECRVFGRLFVANISIASKSRCIEVCERKALEIANDAVRMLSCKQKPNVSEKSTDDATLRYLKNMFGM
jgi:hypothetical protein